MRIVAGQFKGRPLAAPKSRTTRPTSDRARESLFNILAHAPWAPDLDGAAIMDLFAGSGALGFEALSRGARSCHFIETDHSARQTIKANAKQLGVLDAVRIDRRSAAALGPFSPDYDAPVPLAFLDPPYHKGLVLPCLNALREGGWLAEDALIVAETAQDELLALEGTGWQVLDQRTSGAAAFWFLKNA